MVEDERRGGCCINQDMAEPLKEIMEQTVHQWSGSSRVKVYPTVWEWWVRTTCVWYRPLRTAVTWL